MNTSTGTGMSGAILVNGDKVTMTLDVPVTFLPPQSEVVGALNARHDGGGQDFVKIGDDLVCVESVETSATANASYELKPYTKPGELALTVRSSGIAKSAVVFINDKAVLWRDGQQVSIDVNTIDGASVLPQPPPPLPPTDMGPHSGKGKIHFSKQRFVIVAG